MKKSELKQLIHEIVNEISTTSKLSGDDFTTKKELMEMAKSMRETMEYHKKFISENPVIIAEPSIKSSQLKQIIKEIINEVQWDLQTPEGRAKYQADVEKRIGGQLDTLRTQISTDKRKEKAQPIFSVRSIEHNL